MKYPIGIQDFKTIRKDGFVYVDKTALLHKLADEGKTYLLSRPRRFGKSLLVSTLKYYFSGEKDLFTGLAIDSLETKWDQYPIFHIDFNGSDFTIPHTLQRLIKGRVEDWEREYDFQGNPDYSPGERFVRLLAHVHKQTGKRCVVLIDEYDKPLLDVLDTERKVRLDDDELLMEDYNRETLKGFYSAFKAADQDLRFVLLTGVTKFSQVSVFSGFNQPEDISMNSKYDAICGITKEELETVFHDEIDAMAEKLKVTAEEMRDMLKRHYDGYHFSNEMTDIFNPFSVLNALNSRSIQDYWFRTGTPTYLVRLLRHTNENLNDLTGNYYDTSEFVDYRADVERPLPMIYQSGYLTIKDYDPYSNSYLLDLPNNEVKKGFLTLIASNYLGTKESATTEA
ncbi:AAA family ATPase [uncultured Prevotella sp.]|uniref:ATP-binding protein n=1 Tax=uncultured Prevotella sp. TaxID=159272 RepID=UPI0027E31A9B|nr:AAA family ATPase [uncultured Prevotella sp.]